MNIMLSTDYDKFTEEYFRNHYDYHFKKNYKDGYALRAVQNRVGRVTFDLHLIGNVTKATEIYEMVVRAFPEITWPIHYTSNAKKVLSLRDCMFIADSSGRILVLNEKHGTRYIDVRTPVKLSAACIDTVKTRKEEGWYTCDEDNVQVAQLDLFKSQTKTVNQTVDYLLKVLSDHPERILWVGREMLNIIAAREDYEYERYSFEFLEDFS